jgi:hypothetical protein
VLFETSDTLAVSKQGTMGRRPTCNTRHALGALIAQIHHGQTKFVGLEALHHILGDESLDGLPVSPLHRTEL